MQSVPHGAEHSTRHTAVADDVVRGTNKLVAGEV